MTGTASSESPSSNFGAVSTSPYLSGNFAPTTTEFTSTGLTVHGTIPPELNGRFLRIGPNPITEEDPETYHWFSGTGLAHGLALRDGDALWYRSRFVRSDRVAEAMGTEPIPGPRHGAGDNTANTNIIEHAGVTMAIVEAGGLPVSLNRNLDSIERSDFDGTLEGSFTAHPKRDPATGELHAVTYFFAWDHVKYVVVGIDGRVRRSVPVATPGSPMIHDCAITDSSVLIFDSPVKFDLEMAMNGAALPYRWMDEHVARVGVLPREGAADGSDVVWCDVDPCFVFHPLNAYDDENGNVVVDVVRHPKMFATSMNGPNEGPTTLDRWTINPQSATVSTDRISDRNQEFPRVDERVVGRPHRYGYGVTLEEGFAYQNPIKHDLATGSSEERLLGDGVVSQEPVFVPRTPDAGEDDGWMLAYTYDANRHTSDVVIWEAQDFTGAPVATIELGGRVPFGFHGNWVADSA